MLIHSYMFYKIGVLTSFEKSTGKHLKLELLPTNCLSVFYHFEGLALKELTISNKKVL